ncbi:MAG: ATP-binding protein [Candidatus Bathyarchaeia archaeon]
MEPIGKVIEESTPWGFTFKAEIDKPIALHDYVYVDVNEPGEAGVKPVRVLAEIIGLEAKNPLATERLVTDRQASLYSYKLLRAEVLGYLDGEGRIIRPKAAPNPNTPVYRAEDEFLQEYFKGVESSIPLRVGRLINRPGVLVPIHLQDLQYHLGIFAATRAGKSYFAGRLIEEILLNTPFPVIVIDIHADYVKMDQRAEDEGRHGDFDLVVYYPPGASKVEGVTAEKRDLMISPEQLTNEALIELLGVTLGELQEIALRNILRRLRGERRPFGLGDLTAEVQARLDETDEGGNPRLRGQERTRYQSLLARLEDLEEDVSLPPTGIDVGDLMKPKTLSVICLNGLRSRIQDAYCSIIVDLIFRHVVSARAEKPGFTPVFLFIEEAHRVASKTGGSRYAVRTVSTAIREGAKFGLFLTLISQRPRSIDPDILSNIGNYAVFRITNAQDQYMIENASESFSHRLVEGLPSLNQGEAVLVGPFVPLPAHITTLKRRTMHYGVTPNLKEIMEYVNISLERRERMRW